MPIRSLDVRHRRSNRDPRDQETYLRMERPRRRRWPLLLLLAAVAALVLLLVSCSSIGYSMQALAGGAGILAKREPIERVLRRTDLPATERQRLELALALREFAVRELALPDNGSYRSYVRLGRDVVTWNVIAAPTFSVEPRTWCFPVAGCVSYRGYFHESSARAFAEKLSKRGDDVTITGSSAYSTLGWFDDPILDTFLDDEPWRVGALLFHELAHQVAYAADDTTFNESFATAVEELGVERWLATRTGGAADVERSAYDRARTEEKRFRDLLLSARNELEALYAGAQGTADATAASAANSKLAAKLESKRVAMRALGASVDAAIDAGELGTRYAAWRGRDWNNADVAAVADYTIWVPAFRALFAASGGFAPFYTAAKELAALESEPRRLRLTEIESGRI